MIKSSIQYSSENVRLPLSRVYGEGITGTVSAVKISISKVDYHEIVDNLKRDRIKKGISVISQKSIVKQLLKELDLKIKFTNFHGEINNSSATYWFF